MVVVVWGRISAKTPRFQRPRVGKPTISPGEKDRGGGDGDDGEGSATATGMVKRAYPGAFLIAVQIGRAHV